MLDSFIQYIRFKKAIQAIEFLNKSVKIEKVIDIGAGDGKFANILKTKGFNVYTLDKEHGDFHWDLEQPFPFEDFEFDLAVSLAVVEHIKNYQRFLSEIKRISKYTIITTPSPYAKYILSLLAFLGLINKEHIKDHKHYLSKKELENFGFKVKTFEFGLNFICTVGVQDV